MLNVRFAAVAVFICAATVTACAKDSPLSPATQIVFGEWGADGVQVVASDTLTEVTVGCFGGKFAGNVRLNANGTFSVNGNWVPYFLTSTTMPAQMSGQVSGNRITFAVAAYDTIQHQVISVAPATAVFGQHANLVVCP